METLLRNCRKAAVCFSAFLFTAVSVNAQSSERDDANANRPARENVNAPVQQPRVTFRESVKQKTAEQKAGTVATPQAQPVQKTTTATPAAVKPQQTIKLTDAQIAAAKAKREAANPQNAEKKSVAPHEKFSNTPANGGGAALNPSIVKDEVKAVEVVETPKQKVEVTVPATAPMALTQQQIDEMNKAEQAKLARKIAEEKAAFENLPADKKVTHHKAIIEPLEKMQLQNSRQSATAITLALKNAYLDYLNTLKAEFAKNPNAEIAAEIEAVNNKISKL